MEPSHRGALIAGLLIVAACGGGEDAVVERRALGLNDVSMLLPLPSDPAVPVIAGLGGFDGVPLLANGPVVGLAFRGDMGPKSGQLVTLDQLQVVAVRFDLCERARVGACAPGEDGRLRLVLQPVVGASTHDVAIHAFYPIPSAELGEVVQALRALAAHGDVDPAAPLAVRTGGPVYFAELAALVARYARWDRVVRITAMGQRAGSAAFAWVMRGYDVGADGALAAIAIPEVGQASQEIAVQGGDTVYVSEPLVDAPAGFALALNGLAFNAAAPAAQAAALETLVAIDDPGRHDTVDLQCTTCHVATFLTARRAAALGVDPSTVAGAFASRFDTSVASLANAEPRLVRAFGWVDAHPTISQRVANESARVVEEIEARY